MRCLARTSAYQFLCLALFFFLTFQANLSSSSSSPSNKQLCSQEEATALIQFKNSFSISQDNYWGCDRGGIKSYPKTDSWKNGTSCCSWHGVTCDNITSHVIGLDLSCSRLYGSISANSSLFHLHHLQKLNLAFNNFSSSSMPYKFGGLGSLVYLNLSYSFFGGQIPSEVSHLSKLASLDLSGNFDEPLDKHTLEGLVDNLTEVRQLFLDRINMSSINPNAFMNLSSSLRSLSLFGCELRGQFPQNIFHLPNLKWLSLDWNRINFNNLPKFNGSNPLEYLDLSGVSISTELSASIGNLVSLKHLDLSSCNLSGSIPRSLGNLSQLNVLDLSGNYFSGYIPSSLTNLRQLEFLSIASNELEGPIPDGVTAFPNLITLDLHHSLLNGTLPSWLYTVSSLRYIYLSRNQFSGHIKEFQSKSLKDISLDDNKLQGPLPSSICQLVNLTTLFVSSNNLSGIVEFKMFSKLQQLVMLDLSYNSLSLNSNDTTIDYTLPNLQVLYLSSCNVNEFPQFLKDSKGLKSLDLSNNRIHGKVPEWIWDVGKESLIYLNPSLNYLTEVEQLPWKAIQYLDLSSNLIHGDLPIPPFGTVIFYISDNSLSGEVPSVICKLSSLEFLDLSHNNLIGVLPQCFGNLSQSLQVLNLRMNKLFGIIPQTFARGCQLINLNLNGNLLEGPLTRSLLNCTGLEVLDLGNNKINDTFPHWLESLPQLQVLVLRSNQLHGSIHGTKSNTSFSKIQIFDLSSNYFTGMLPVQYIKNFQSMINLKKDIGVDSYMGVPANVNRVNSGSTFYSYSIGIVIKGQDMELLKIFAMLTSIDLSNNKFQGEIPTVIGKLSSLIGLNLSHNNLSSGIPSAIGDIVSLEWLDLSSNKLVGMIPERLLDLTSLAFFNVSENQLHGQIPQGKQFNTFLNDSYEGNKGLCGFPVSKGCNNNEPPPSNLPRENDGSKSNISFGWKVVLLGYGCGLIFGLATGYVVFQTGKPKCFVSLVEDQQHKRRKKPKTGNRNGGGRRT